MYTYHYYYHHYLDSPPSSSPRKNRWTPWSWNRDSPKRPLFAKYLHRDSWLISCILKSTKQKCVLLSLLQPPLQAGAVGKNAAVSRPWMWCVVDETTLNTWVLDVQKNWSMQGHLVFWEIYSAWFMVFKKKSNFHLLKGVWNSGDSPQFFEAAMKNTWMKKQMSIITEMTLDLGSWKRTGPKIWPPESVHFWGFFLRLRHPKLSSLSTASWEIILWWVFPMDVVYLCMHDHILELSS